MTARTIPLANALTDPLAEVSVWVESRDFSRLVDVSIVAWSPEGRFIVPPAPLELITTGDEEYHGPPTFRLPMRLAQQLADALYKAGVRPTDTHGSAGQLGAVKAHLQDMRVLVAKQSDVKFGDVGK